MNESVILNSPVLLAGILIAVLLFVLGRRTRSAGPLFPLLSAGTGVAVLVGAYLSGAALTELIVLLLAFTALYLSPYLSGGGKRG